MYVFPSHAMDTTDVTRSLVDGYNRCVDIDVEKWDLKMWMFSAITEGGALQSVNRWVFMAPQLVGS